MGFAFDGDDQASAGDPVIGKGVAGHQLFLVGKYLAHADQPGDQLGHFSFGRIFFKPFGEGLAQFVGFNLAQHGNAHAFGPCGCVKLFRRGDFLAHIQRCHIHLEDGFVTHARAVELQFGALKVDRVFDFDARHVNWRGKNANGQNQTGEAG